MIPLKRLYQILAFEASDGIASTFLKAPTQILLVTGFNYLRSNKYTSLQKSQIRRHEFKILYF